MLASAARRALLSAARRALLSATVGALVVALVPACERAPDERICPDVGAGALVVTELRGAQTDDDTWGQWIELHNPTSAAIPLAGIGLHLLRLDGGDEATVLVRDHALVAAAGAYVVLGRFTDETIPTHVDYAYGNDLEADLFAGAALELRSCEVLLDRVIWRQLPTAGTHSLGKAPGAAPDATTNDDEALWCTDATAAPPDPALPGTPGEENHPCS